MTIIDRYLLFTFLRIFAVCVLSFTALYIVIHLFSNLDEVVTSAGISGGMPQFIYEFYGPRSLDIFDKTAGVLILVSAVFAFSLMQRKRELTALQAAGVSRLRVARPILIASVVLLGLTVVNREYWIPQVREQLVRDARDWHEGGAVAMHFYKDSATGLLIRGDELIIKENKITSADIQIPGYVSTDVSRIHAQWATVEEANANHPRGIYMHQVSYPEDLTELASIDFDGDVVIYSPADHPWLRERQCFVAADLDVSEIAYGKQLKQYSTLSEMTVALQKPRMFFGHTERVTIHTRILKPLVDLTLLLLGFPLIVARLDRNIFIAAGMCLLIVIVVQGTAVGCMSLGAYSLIRPAALAAWLPLIVFGPLAIVAIRRLNL